LSSRPKIGITGPDRGGGAAWFFTALSVWMAGGWPVRIQPSHPRPIADIDGLIVGGGADVDPDAYEQEDFIDAYFRHTINNPKYSLLERIRLFFKNLIYSLIFLIRKIYSRKSHNLDKDRDKLEFHLVDQAIKRGMPVLGICRGAQLINVYFKGDLYKEIEPLYIEHVNRVSIFPVKKVTLKPGSKLAEMIRKKQLKVNALHHQAVKEPGQGIDIVAREENGVVQAIESTEHRFVIGVQWHPEYLINKKNQRKIFKYLVECAKDNCITTASPF
jgi:putative glutamine amidotransferase